MLRLLSAILWLLVSVSGAAWAGPGEHEERLVKRDGSIVSGEVVGFRNGNYIVKAGSSTLEVPAHEVRTILRQDLSTHVAEPAGGEFRLALREVLDGIALRAHPAVSSENQRVFEDAAAQVIRGEWDLAMRGLRLLLDREPDWTEPQLLRAMVASERGEHGEALQIALRIESQQTSDVFVQRVAAEVFRRGGFARRHAQALQRVLLQDERGGRVYRDLAQLWWPVDRRQAEAHWAEYIRFDPRLADPACAEGESRRRIEHSLAMEDWVSAQAAFGELVRRYPWATEQAKPLQVEILESRLKSAEASGRLEEAVVCCDTLLELESDRAEEWRARLGGLRSFLLGRALQSSGPEELRSWCRRNAHLLGSDQLGWRPRLSNRFQQFGAEALGRGEIARARSSFLEASRWDQHARPVDLEPFYAQAVARVKSDVRLGRDSRAVEIFAILGENFPEKADDWMTRLSGELRSSVASSLTPQDLTALLDQFRRVLRPKHLAMGPRSESPSSATGDQASSVGADEVVAASAPDGQSAPMNPKGEVYARDLIERAMSRYFPHEPGARWVYKCSDGTREERRVKRVSRDGAAGLRIVFEIEGSNGSKHEFLAFLRGADLIFHSPLVPPGEYALRYPFTNESHWAWEKEIFRFKRQIERPRMPLQLPLGTFTDYFVVHGENSVSEAQSGAVHRTDMRVTYVSGIGIVRIESDNSALDRTLVEFHPAP